MADVLKEFLVSIAFGLDAQSQAKVEAASKATEAKVTADNKANADKRVESEQNAAGARVAIVAALAKLLRLEEQKLSDARDKTRKNEADKQDKREREAEKKSRERREAAQKEIQAAAVQMTAFMGKLKLVAETVVAGSIATTLEHAAAGFEKLNYASQRIGAAPKSINAFAYASSQLGSSVEEANGSLEAFGEKMRRFPGYVEGIERLGVRTKDANGHMRDSVEIATDLGDALRKIRDADSKYGYTNAITRGSLYGFTENETRAMMDPQFRSRQQEYAGANPGDNVAARSGTAFEQSIRRLGSVINGVITKIEDSLFKNLQPALDKLAAWFTEHGNDIAVVVTRIVDGLAKIAEAFVKSDAVKGALDLLDGGLHQLADWVASDDFKKDVKGFIDDIGALAKSIRSALVWIGVIPDKASALPARANQDQIDKDNAATFGPATHRYGTGLFGLRTQRRSDEERHRLAQPILERFRRGEGVSGTVTPNTRLSDLDEAQQKDLEAALAKTEGGAGSLADRNNNPGNLKFAGQEGAVEGEKGFAKFSTKEAGMAALHRTLFGGGRYTGLTIGQAMEVYSPASDGNDPAAKAAFIASHIGQRSKASIGSGDPVAIAESLLHQNEAQARAALGSKMSPGEWCADFVNGVLKESGGKGINGSLARTFANWGKSVAANDIQRNDVLVVNNGGHVGIATGERDKNGNIGIIAGNTRDGRGGHDVEKYFVNPDSIYAARRGDPPASPDYPAKGRRTPDITWSGGDPHQDAIDNARTQFNRAVERLQNQPDPFAMPHPLGVTPGLQSSIDNSRSRGDTTVNHNQTFNINGIQKPDEVASATRLSASRGHQDLLRNMQAMEA